MVLAAACAAAAQEQGVPADSGGTVVSVDKIREGLQRRELQIPPLPPEYPTFRSGVEVELETALAAMRRALREEARARPWEFATPKPPGVIAQVDILPALASLVTRIKRMRYEHAEAEARQMVREELAAFCSQHDCSQAAELPIDEGIIVAPK